MRLPNCRTFGLLPQVSLRDVPLRVADLIDAKTEAQRRVVVSEAEVGVIVLELIPNIHRGLRERGMKLYGRRY